MPTLEQCAQRCLTIFFEDYGARKHLNCPKCVAKETRAKRRRAGKPGGDRRDREIRLADVPEKSQAA